MANGSSKYEEAPRPTAWGRFKSRLRRVPGVDLGFRVAKGQLDLKGFLLARGRSMLRKPAAYFWCCGRRYKYFYALYNQTHRNERCVELPVALEFVRSGAGKDILEIGNVLDHYVKLKDHTVIDKYEKRRGVLNVDVSEFKAEKRYDLIVSISTFEHIGFDDASNDPDKVLEVYRGLKSLLKDEGRILVTIPIGYNPHMTRHLRESRFDFQKLIYLKRVSPENRWVEAGPAEALAMEYGRPFPGANALFIGVYASGGRGA